MLATALHSPFIYRSSRWLSLASVLRSPRLSSRTSCVRRAIIALLVVAHVLEKALRVLRSSMLPLCSLARERLALIVAHSCNSLALALRSSSLHRRSCLQQPCAHSSCTHRPSSSLILSSIVRSSTLELENVLRSSLLVHAHARERLAFISLHMFGTCLHSL